MCGILGQLEREQPVDRARFGRQLATLSTRGPDGSGVWFSDDGRVALGHQRLSIIDLSANGAQPMTAEDGAIWLVFNGEIYNYRALREELIAAGHRFRSQTDSEVILHGYEQWGDEVVERLRGIFAFGIWDGSRKRLLLARDHLGVKPLYYWHSGGRLIFASQPRAILEAEGVGRSPNLEALSTYFAYGYVAGEQSAFAGMSKLPAGHRLIYANQQTTIQRYWRPEYRPSIHDEAEAVALTGQMIAESVQLQMVSDVPVGVFLSGGIDSCSVAAYASRYSSSPLPSFTIGFDEPQRDERRYAREASELIGTTYHEAVLSLDDAVGLIPDYVNVYDEPFYDSSGLPTMLVSRLARDAGCPVILSGDGGDEVFAGYLWYDKFNERMTQAERPRWLQQLWARAPRDPLSEYFSLVGYLNSDAQRQLFGPATREAIADHLAPLREAYDADASPTTAARLMDLQTYLVDDILTKVDRASMACGVEARVPLLDHRLVETALSIDGRILYGDQGRKGLMKKAVADCVPASLLTARKKGFSIPLSDWMTGRLRETALGLLSGGKLVERGIVRREGMMSLIGKRHASIIWLLLAAELWVRHWVDREDLETIRKDLGALAPLQC